MSLITVIDDLKRKKAKSGRKTFDFSETDLEIIHNLEKIRTSKNISQTRLAKIAGVSQSCICQIEMGKYLPGYDTFIKIRTALESILIDNPKETQLIVIMQIAFSLKDTISKADELMTELDHLLKNYTSSDEN